MSHGRISAVGKFPLKNADRVLDAQGGYLAPGFIDAHSELDHHFTLFDPQARMELLGHGATTAIGGQDGYSLAPWTGAQAEMARKWGGVQRNADWRSVAEFRNFLRKHDPGFSFGTLAGGSTLCHLLRFSGKGLSAEEFAALEMLVARALREGALGLSLDMDQVPRLAPKQLVRLAEKVADMDKVLALKMHHEPLGESLAAALRAGKETGVRLVLADVLPKQGEPEEWEYVESKVSSVKDVYVEVSPFARSTRPISALLPDWARRGNLRDMQAVLRDARLARKVAEDLPVPGPDELRITRAGRQKELLGLTLREVMAMYEVPDAREALVHIMRITGLNAAVEQENLRPEMVKEVLAHERALVRGAHPNLLQDTAPLQAYADEPPFAAFLAQAATEGEAALARAVMKITSLPARIYGFRDRGEIASGKAADMVLFKDSEIKLVVRDGRVIQKPENVPFRTGAAARA